MYLASLKPNDAAANAAVDEARRFKAAVDDPSLTAGRPMPPLAGGVTGAYFLDLRAYRPADVAASLSCPIFVAAGERDYQVGPEDFEGWRGALRARPRATFVQYPGLNHLFVAGTGPSTPLDYEQSAHVDAALIDGLARWIVSLPSQG